MYRTRVLAFILAGGKGERLYPLTRERGKPAVPFGGKYRIIDFVLSNFVNSEIYAIYVLVQYKAQSLIEHLRTGWRLGGPLPDHFVLIVPPQMRWKGGAFLPRVPESLERLDLLLLTMAKPRRVHQDGIDFQGFRYLDATLAAYVGEDVIIRYDPRDMAELRVYFHRRLILKN